jgi:hypothetical protein
MQRCQCFGASVLQLISWQPAEAAVCSDACCCKACIRHCTGMWQADAQKRVAAPFLLHVLAAVMHAAYEHCTMKAVVLDSVHTAWYAHS